MQCIHLVKITVYFIFTLCGLFFFFLLFPQCMWSVVFLIFKYYFYRTIYSNIMIILHYYYINIVLQIIIIIIFNIIFLLSNFILKMEPKNKQWQDVRSVTVLNTRPMICRIVFIFFICIIIF